MQDAIAKNDRQASVIFSASAQIAYCQLELRRAPAPTRRRLWLGSILLLQLCLLPSFAASSSLTSNLQDYEGRRIVAIELVFEGSQPDPAAQAQFLSLLRVTANSEFSAVRVRDSLQALFDSERVANARVEVVEEAGKTGPIRLRFVVQRQVQ